MKILDPPACAAIEARLRSCWQAQQQAELDGDQVSADAMRDTIDELLETLTSMLTGTT